MDDDDFLDDLGLTGVLIPFAETALIPHKCEVHDSLKAGDEYRPVVQPVPCNDIDTWVRGPNGLLVPPTRKGFVFRTRFIGPEENMEEELSMFRYEIPSEIATKPRVPLMMLRTYREEMIPVTPRGLKGKNGLQQRKFVTAGDVQMVVVDWMKSQEKLNPRDYRRHEIRTERVNVNVNGTMKSTRVFMWKGIIQDLNFENIWSLCL